MGVILRGDMDPSTQQHQDDAITPQEHLADKTIFVHASPSRFTLLGPHLLYILEDHVTVAIKGLHSGEQFSIVST